MTFLTNGRIIATDFNVVAIYHVKVKCKKENFNDRSLTSYPGWCPRHTERRMSEKRSLWAGSFIKCWFPSGTGIWRHLPLNFLTSSAGSGNHTFQELYKFLTGKEIPSCSGRISPLHRPGRFKYFREEDKAVPLLPGKTPLLTAAITRAILKGDHPDGS